MNDITADITSHIHLFAGDCRPIVSPSDHTTIQSDLNILATWAHGTSNTILYNVLDHHIPLAIYTLNNQPLVIQTNILPWYPD